MIKVTSDTLSFVSKIKLPDLIQSQKILTEDADRLVYIDTEKSVNKVSAIEGEDIFPYYRQLFISILYVLHNINRNANLKCKMQIYFRDV